MFEISHLRLNKGHICKSFNLVMVFPVPAILLSLDCSTERGWMKAVEPLSGNQTFPSDSSCTKLKLHNHGNGLCEQKKLPPFIMF